MTEDQDRKVRADDDEEGWFWIGILAAFLILGGAMYGFSGNDRILTAHNTPTDQTIPDLTPRTLAANP